MARPVPDKRVVEGLQRLRHNTDFAAFSAYLQAEYEYCKEALVTQPTENGFAQMQGRARELQDILKYINQKD